MSGAADGPLRVDLDLGDGHALRYVTWDPDPSLNPQYADLPGEPEEPVGAIIGHYRADGSYCEGIVHFDTPRARRMTDAESFWTIESRNPLTLSPSVQCTECPDHGHVRDGRWARA